MKSYLSLILLVVLFLGGCSSKSFLVMEDGPKGYAPNQTLGVRAGVDTGSLSPTERYSWLEVCDRVEVPSFFGMLTDTQYVNCEVAANHMAQAARTTTTGYIAGVVGPVIQTGLTAGAVAYTGHAIGRGIGRSGDNIQTTTTNTTSSTGGKSGVYGSGNNNGSATGGSVGDITAGNGNGNLKNVGNAHSDGSSASVGNIDNGNILKNVGNGGSSSIDSISATGGSTGSVIQNTGNANGHGNIIFNP